MKTKPIEGRTHYRNSGKVNWTKFLAWSGVTIATAAALAVLMCLLFDWGIYLVGLVPIMAGLGVAGTVALAVKRGHCRSPLVGGLLGLAAGLLLYFGYYYASMVRDLGPDLGQNVSLLPQYIYLRLQTDVIRSTHDTTPEREDQRPHPERFYFNAGFFALELGFVLLFTCAAGIRKSRRSYCESCREWMNREATTFLPEIGPAMIEAFKAGSPQSLAALFTSPQKPSAPHTAVAVEYCPELKEGRTQDCPMFVSVKQVTELPKGVTIDTFEQAKGKLLVRQVMLYTDETPALLSRFGSLEKVAGTTASQALQDLQVEVKPRSVGAVAQVMPVDPQFAGKVMTKKAAMFAASILILALLLIFGSIGLAALGAMIGFPDNPTSGGVPIFQRAAGIALLVLAGVLFVSVCVFVIGMPDAFQTRFYRRRIDREFARRPNHLVRPDDPEAIFVQIIPRANWAKLKLDDASDLGFLKVDQKTREVLFEGDKEYYRVPAAAITSCEIEIFISGEGTHAATKLFRVVLQADGPSGFWETPIAQRGGGGMFRTKRRLRWAKEVQAKILSILPGRTAA